MPRFHAPDLDPDATAVVLPPDEARHLTRVLRLGVGAVVAVFDGRGREFAARVASVGRAGVTLDLLEPRASAAEPTCALTLAQVVLKGDKMDEVVRDAVMVGAAAVQPLVSARAESSLSALRKADRVARWQRVAVASAKQCGRAVVPPIRPASTLGAWVTGPTAVADDAGALALALVEPSVPAGEGIARLGVSPGPRSAVVLVGPEGGWTPAEIEQMAARGVRLVSLGPRTLRADAVPIIALSLLQFMWGDL